MFAPLLLVLVLPPQDPVGPGAFAGNFPSYVDGLRWDSVVGRQHLEASPRWREDEESPPLAPRAAVRAARATLQQIHFPQSGSGTWKVHRVTLTQLAVVDAWIYVVEFLPLPKPPPAGASGVIAGPVTSLVQIVVLMNGRAIVPVPHP